MSRSILALLLALAALVLVSLTAELGGEAATPDASPSSSAARESGPGPGVLVGAERAPGRAAVGTSAAVPDEEEPRDDRVAPAAPAPVRVRGRVVDVDGSPLAGADVALRARRLGEVLERATSAADGRFELSATADKAVLSAELAGYALLTQHRTAREGGVDVELRMTRTGALAVTFAGPDGAPLAGCDVWAHAPSWAERRASSKREAGPGRFVFDDVRSGVPLRLNLALPHSKHVVHTHWRGRVVLEGDSAPRSTGIVVEPGETLELTVALDGALRIEGVVRGADGAGLAGAWVAAFDAEGLGGAGTRPICEGSADEDGRFALLLPHGVPERVRVVGARRAPGGWGGLGQALEGAEVVASVNDAVAGVLTVALDARETLSICGRVVGPEGERLRSRVIAVPAGAPGPYGPGSLGLAVTTMARHDDRMAGDGVRQGDFELRGLLPGRYDLYASFDLPGRARRFSLGESVLPSVEAGAEDVVLRSPRDLGVRVRVRVDGPVDEMTVTVARVLGPVGAPGPSPTGTIRGPWPEGLPLLGGRGSDGGYEGTTSVGYAVCHTFRVEGARLLLPRMQAGTFVIGVASRAGGVEQTAVSTGLVTLEPGAHRLDFQTVPAGGIEGRLEPRLPGERLAVRVRDEDGGDVVTRAASRERGFARVHAVEPDGRFALELVPAGPLRLAIGTQGELERGVARRELDLVVEPGGTTRMDVRGL